jgi:glycosyltransferase involved in cell wall biosynthesis
MVSVALCSYNGEAFIALQVQSILQQLPPDGELIVSDDGSTDGTMGILCRFEDRRIRILRNRPTKGVVGNFGAALTAVRGDIIFLADQDDVWRPTKITECLEALQGADMVVHDCSVVDRDGAEISPSFFAANATRRGFLANVIRNGYLGCCMCFRASLLRRALPFPPGLPMHDLWLGQLAGIRGGVRFLDRRLMEYRRHGENASSTLAESRRTLAQKLTSRVRVFSQVVARSISRGQ